MHFVFRSLEFLHQTTLRKHYLFQICKNGIVTFNGSYDANYIPTSVDDRSVFKGKAVVAPYFSNIDVNKTVTVYHRIFNDVEYASDTNLNATMSKLFADAGYGDMDVFLLVVVTWEVQRVAEFNKSITDVSKHTMNMLLGDNMRTFRAASLPTRQIV